MTKVENNRFERKIEREREKKIEGQRKKWTMTAKRPFGLPRGKKSKRKTNAQEKPMIWRLWNEFHKQKKHSRKASTIHDPQKKVKRKHE